MCDCVCSSVAQTSFALRVFHWPTLGAVRGAERTAAALPEEEAPSTERRGARGAALQSPAFTQCTQCSLCSVVVVADRKLRARRLCQRVH